MSMEMPFITREEAYKSMAELAQNDLDMSNAFNIMREAINAQAEILALTRYTIQKYLPAAHLEEAAREYKALRDKQIEEEKAKALLPDPASN